MYIKDTQTGRVHRYGSDTHDSLIISKDGRTLTYHNLQCGEGSRFGTFVFCEEDGTIPECTHGEDWYFDIGGSQMAKMPEIIEERKRVKEQAMKILFSKGE